MKISQQLIALMICAVSIIILVAASAFYCVRQLMEGHTAVYHSAATLETTQSVCFHMSYAAVAQRGYLITNHDPCLDEYHTEVEATKESMARLRSLVAQDPEEKVIVEQFQRDVDERLASFDTTLQVYLKDGQAAAFTRVKSGIGSVAMRRALKHATELRDHEMAEVGALMKEVEVNAMNTQLTIVIGSILAGIIIVISNLIFSKHLSSAVRSLLRASQNVIRGRFESVVDLRANNELGDIAGAFNALAGHLKEKSKQLDVAHSRLGEIESDLHDKDSEMASLKFQLFELASFVSSWTLELGYMSEHQQKLQDELQDSQSLSDMLGTSLQQISRVAREVVVMAETVNRRGVDLVQDVDRITQQTAQVTNSVESAWSLIPETKDMINQLEAIDNELSILDLVSALYPVRGERVAESSEVAVLHERLKQLRQTLGHVRSKLNINLSHMQQSVKEAIDAAGGFDAAMRSASRPLDSVAHDTKELMQAILSTQTEMINVERLHQRQVANMDEMGKLMTLFDVSITREKEFLSKVRHRTTGLSEPLLVMDDEAGKSELPSTEHALRS